MLQDLEFSNELFRHAFGIAIQGENSVEPILEEMECGLLGWKILYVGVHEGMCEIIFKSRKQMRKRERERRQRELKWFGHENLHPRGKA